MPIKVFTHAGCEAIKVAIAMQKHYLMTRGHTYYFKLMMLSVRGDRVKCGVVRNHHD